MPVDHQTEPGDAIAIVGIGGIFAASDSPDRLWANVRRRHRRHARRPAGSLARSTRPRRSTRASPQPDHVYTTRGGFVDPIRFDPTGTGLDPALVERLDPVFHLALAAASQAWRDAEDRAIDRRRAGVVFGNIVLPTETASALSLELLGRAFEEQLGVRVARPPDAVRAAAMRSRPGCRRRSSPRRSGWEAWPTRSTPPAPRRSTR